MSKPVILTGLRATNDVHLGNYLGALLPMVDMTVQKSSDYQINLMVADLHSFTTPSESKSLQKDIMSNLKVYVAAGMPLDNDLVSLYRQSYIPAHSELTWILDCFTGMGEMSRMTQFKDKSTKLIEDRISVGLFNYPVLMACDVLLYGASYVPVGEDQTQHLEYIRDIAIRINSQFGEIFVVPETITKQHEFFGKDQGLRIRNLQDPTKKMSKSDESGKGVIFLTDDPETAKRKVMSAETDSLNEVQYDYQTRPGVSNLLDIFELLGGNKAEFIGQQQYGPLKSSVADKLAVFIGNFKARLDNVDEAAILNKLEADERHMNDLANTKLLQVQKAIGLR